MTHETPALPSLLAFDGLTCTAMGALLLAAADPIAGLTQIPAGLLWWAGLLLLPTAAFMAIASRQAPTPRWMTSLIVAGNGLWALISLALPLLGPIQPNLLGYVFLLGQGAVVAALGVAEYAADRRAHPAPTRRVTQ